MKVTKGYARSIHSESIGQFGFIESRQNFNDLTLDNIKKETSSLGVKVEGVQA